MQHHLLVNTIASYNIMDKFIADEYMFVSARVSVCGCMCWRAWVGELSHIYKPIIISLLISLCSKEINFPLCRYLSVRARVRASVWMYVCLCRSLLLSLFHSLFTLMSHQSAYCVCACVRALFPAPAWSLSLELRTNQLKR